MSALIIEGFDPLRLTLPAEVDVKDVIEVELPPVRVKLLDLSLGGVIEDRPHISADMPSPRIQIRLSEPATVGEIVNMLIGSASAWQEAWQGMQNIASSQGALLN